MHLKLRHIIAAAVMLAPVTTKAQWTAIGNSTGISAGGSSYQNITHDSAGNLYLAYYDSTVSKGSVMKYDGNTWSYVGGSAGVTSGAAFYNTIAATASGNLYYGFQDGSSSSKLSVKNYTSGAWGTQWQNLSNGAAYFSSLKIGANGNPYVVFRDLGISGTNLSVKRYDGSNWIGVGTTGFASSLPYYSTLVMGSNDSIYVSLVNALTTVEVYKISATASATTAWQAVGNTSAFTTTTSSIFQMMASMAIDSSNRLYVAYVSPVAEGSKMKVKKYENGAWSSVGADNFSAGAAKYISIAVTPGGTPYVAFSDGSSNQQTTVMKFDGTQWNVLGNAGISSGAAINNSLTLDAAGNPVVAFADAGYGGKTVVMRYLPPCNNNDPAAATGSLGCVTFNYSGAPVTYTTVRAADGNVWLQQNLGSAVIATSATDTAAFGDVFQWGRWDDGHQKRNVATGAAPVTNNPGGVGTNNATFFTGTPGWWTGGTLTDTWSGSTPAQASSVNGCDPCKAIGAGWRLPTQQEWATIVSNENITSPATAYSSNLKLTTGGNRNSSGNYDFAGTRGYYWSSTTSSTGAKYLYYSSAITNPSAGGLRAQGMSIRCLKMLVPVVDSVKVGVLNNATPQITTNAGTLQMTALVYPFTVSQNVTWSIVPGTGAATITSNGLVTAQTNGTIWVKATSVQDTTKSDSLQVFVSGQIIPVDSVRVRTQNNVAPVITTQTGLQMVADVYPANAVQTVNWSILPGTGTANVSAAGYITPGANGTIWVKAASVQDTTKSDSLQVTINIAASTSVGTVPEQGKPEIYPNPVKDILQIDLPGSGATTMFTISVFSTNGNLLQRNNYSGNHASIRVQDLPSGIYLLRISTAQTTWNNSFIRQ